VAAAGGIVDTRRERAWTNSTLAAQKLLVSRLALQGVRIRPDYSFARVLDGFSALIDPGAIPIIERDSDVAGVFPVRVAYPASFSSRVLSRSEFGPLSGTAPASRCPASTGAASRSRCSTRGSILRSRICVPRPARNRRDRRGSRGPGSGEAGRLDAGRAPRDADGGPARRRGGPSGLSGVATGARCYRSASRGGSPMRSGTGRSMRAATVDRRFSTAPSTRMTNGDAHDAARVALVSLAAPFAGFADGPEALAAEGALALDTLVVAPAGNDGSAAAGYGDVSGPGGGAAVLTVGAIDARTHIDRVRAVVRAGLTTLFDGNAPLLGAVAPTHRLDLRVAVPRGKQQRRASDGPAPHGLLHTPRRQHRRRPCCARTDRRLTDTCGSSRLHGRRLGRAALRPRTGAAGRRSRARRVAAGAGRLDPDRRGACRARPDRTPAARGDRASCRCRHAEHRAGSSRKLSSSGSPSTAREADLVAPGVGLATSDPGANPDGSPRFATRQRDEAPPRRRSRVRRRCSHRPARRRGKRAGRGCSLETASSSRANR